MKRRVKGKSMMGVLLIAMILSLCITPVRTTHASSSIPSSGLQLWLKADAITGLSDGASVSTWADTSGIGNHAAQADPAKMPKWFGSAVNGKPVVRFDGTNDYLNLGDPASLTIRDGITIITVAKMNGANANASKQTVYGRGSAVTTDLDFAGKYSRSFIKNATEQTVNMTGSIQPDFYNQYTTTYSQSNATAEFYVNSVMKATQPLTGLIRDNATDDLPNTIGASNAWHTDGIYMDRWLNGDIAEVIIYNRVLTEIERKSVDQYLKSKYMTGEKPLPSSGRALWLKADDIIGLNDGDAVSAWNDAAGNGVNATQSNSAKQPKWYSNVANGKPVVRFDGVDDYLSLGDPASLTSNQMTIFAVSSANSLTSNHTIYARGEAILMDYASPQSGRMHVKNTSSLGDTPTGTVQANLFNQFTGMYSNLDGNIRYFINGSLVDERYIGGNIRDNLTDDNNTIGGKYAWHTGDVYYYDKFLNGDIAELIIYNSALTDEERQTVENYLQKKYAAGGQIMTSADASGVTISGNWQQTSSNLQKFGESYRTMAKNSVTFRPNLPVAGSYNVYMRWPANASNSTSVPVKIQYKDGQVASTTVNETVYGGQWSLLGSYPFEAGRLGSVVLTNEGTSGNVVADAVKFELVETEGIIMDNATTGNNFQPADWITSTAGTQMYGTDFYHDNNTGKGLKQFAFQPSLPWAGLYNVYAWWPADSGNANNVPVAIEHSGGTYNTTINQRTNGMQWNLLGTYSMPQNVGGKVILTTTGTNGYVVADAVKFVPADPVEVIVDNADPSGKLTPVVVQGNWTAATSGADKYGANYLTDNGTNKTDGSITFTPNLSSAGLYDVYLWWPAEYTQDDASVVQVVYSGGTAARTVNQRIKGGKWNYVGGYNFNSGTGGNVSIRTNATKSMVVADAVKFVKVDAAPAGYKSVLPGRSTDVALNPDKGWVMYNSSWNSPYKSQDVLDRGGLGYTRYNWADIETAEGVYNWTAIDNDIGAWASQGKKFAFGVMAINTSNLNTYNTPKWVFDAGAEMVVVTTPANAANGVRARDHYVPVGDDPVFLSKYADFLLAMGQKYDNNPNVEFIDIRSYGNWGEGHFYPLSQYDTTGKLTPISDAKLQEHLNMHLAAFHNKRLVLPWGTPLHNAIYDWAVNNGIAMRIDGIVNTGDGSEVARTIGKQPSIFEYHSGYANLVNQNWWFGPTYQNQGYPLDIALENGKPSFISMSQYGEADFLKYEKPLIERMANEMGYHYELLRAMYPANVTKGTNFNLTLKWRNVGVAQSFKDYKVAIGLMDTAGNLVATSWTPSYHPMKWYPDQNNENKVSVNFSGSFAVGTYKLVVGIFENATDTSPSIKIGNQGRTATGWYSLDTITIQ